ncbi:Tethering factor for nuclear proteasome sts1 [Elasticomyces elasticus]|nr:Tethering factor for nuclear proteasome sts1 [Elasticomyces elasticus]KAK4988698.1 Tethering factor for nuclear proteasome sts1 [Elasticomyces elasticus]
MNSVLFSNPLHAPHLLVNPRLSPSRSDSVGTERMSGRKRKADDDLQDRDYDRMSTSPSASPATSSRPLPHPITPRSTKRTRTSVSAGRPLTVPRLLETLDAEDMRGLLRSICDRHPEIASDVIQAAPRPSVASTIAVLERYEATLRDAFPLGSRTSSDYSYNRVRQPLVQYIEALKDFTPHFLPPNEQQPTTSLNYLDAVTNMIHRLPNWDTYQHNRHKQEAYDEISKAWALVIREGAKRGGGFHLQYGGWDQKLMTHNEESGGRLEEAVQALKSSVAWPSDNMPSPAAGLGDRESIRHQLMSGTYGQDVAVSTGSW